MISQDHVPHQDNNILQQITKDCEGNPPLSSFNWNLVSQSEICEHLCGLIKACSLSRVPTIMFVCIVIFGYMGCLSFGFIHLSM